MWEYKIRPVNPKSRADKAFENELNELGRDGWELVGVQENALYFKRLKETDYVQDVYTISPSGERWKIGQIGTWEIEGP